MSSKYSPPKRQFLDSALFVPTLCVPDKQEKNLRYFNEQIIINVTIFSLFREVSLCHIRSARWVDRLGGFLISPSV